MRGIGVKLASVLTLLTVGWTGIGPSAAQDGNATAAVMQTADAVFSKAVAEGRTAGAVVAYVDGSGAATMRSYGFEDMGRGIPLEGTTSELPIASVTKTFTALAVAQLYEAGKIKSLRDPANLYLKRFHLPKFEGTEVTLWDLLHHRAGFEEASFDTLSYRVTTDEPSVAEYERLSPNVVRKPGTISGYSNFGASVLGAVVQDVSGERYADYLKEHIFQPLGMNHTFASYTTPLANEAVAYDLSDKSKPRRLKTIYPAPIIAPAGGIITTAWDIALYMQALLADGGGSVISQRTRDLLLQQSEADNPLVGGFGLLYETLSLGGVRVAHHGGVLPGFRSEMLLLPDQGKGLFVFLMNWDTPPPVPFTWPYYRNLLLGAKRSGAPSLDMPDALVPLLGAMLGPDAFSAAKFPKPAAGAVNLDPRVLFGTYLTTRSVETTMFRLRSLLFADTMTVEPGTGGLKINGRDGYKQIRPGLFASPHSPQLAGFFKDPGTGRMAASMTMQPSAYVKTTFFWERPAILMGAFQILTAIVATGLLAAMWMSDNRFQRWGRWAAIGSALCAIAIPVILFGWRNDLDDLVGESGRFIAARAAANLLLLSAGALCLSVALDWLRNGLLFPAGWSSWHRIAMTVAAIALCCFYADINYLGFRFP